MNDNTKNLPFEVPKDYFEQLSGKIMQGVNAANHQSDTHSEILNGISQNNPLEVPQDYFESLGSQVMQAIQSENDASEYLHTTIGNEAVYEVPKAYFEQLADNVLQRIQHTDEDLVDTSMIDAYKDINVYEVPVGYFDNLHFTPSQETATTKPVQTMQLPKRSLKWTNWAAAACVFIIFGIGGMWMMNSEHSGSGTKPSNPALLASLTLEQVSDEDIENYIENDQESFDIYSLMDNASASTKEQKKSPKATENLLDNVSQEEIEAYLESEGI